MSTNWQIPQKEVVKILQTFEQTLTWQIKILCGKKESVTRKALDLTGFAGLYRIRCQCSPLLSLKYAFKISYGISFGFALGRTVKPELFPKLLDRVGMEIVQATTIITLSHVFHALQELVKFCAALWSL